MVPLGCSTREQFFGWINERHRIWVKRFLKSPYPWTDDPILTKFKFTNVFREFDRGTVVLKEMIRPLVEKEALPDIIFNVWWYRLFNHHEHAINLGPVLLKDWERVNRYIKDCHKSGKKIFTSAHMTTGQAGIPKYVTYAEAVHDAADNSEALAEIARETRSMKRAYEELLHCFMVGQFVSYEIVCDLRFTPVLSDTDEALLWANVGPGAKRGLRRLGYDWSTAYNTTDFQVAAMRELYLDAPKYLGKHMTQHYGGVYPPFELREIEHSLCEFDKYERVRLGEGRPRELFKKGSFHDGQVPVYKERVR